MACPFEYELTFLIKYGLRFPLEYELTCPSDIHKDYVFVGNVCRGDFNTDRYSEHYDVKCSSSDNKYLVINDVTIEMLAFSYIVTC